MNSDSTCSTLSISFSRILYPSSPVLFFSVSLPGKACCQRQTRTTVAGPAAFGTTGRRRRIYNVTLPTSVTRVPSTLDYITNERVFYSVFGILSARIIRLPTCIPIFNPRAKISAPEFTNVEKNHHLYHSLGEETEGVTRSKKPPRRFVHREKPDKPCKRIDLYPTLRSDSYFRFKNFPA